MCLKTSIDRKKQGLSRGGASKWKQCPQSREVLAGFSLEVFRQRKKRKGSQLEVSHKNTFPKTRTLRNHEGSDHTSI